MAAAQRRRQCAHLLGGEVAHLGFDDLALGGATGGGGEVLADRQRAAEEVEHLYEKKLTAEAARFEAMRMEKEDMQSQFEQHVNRRPAPNSGDAAATPPLRRI